MIRKRLLTFAAEAIADLGKMDKGDAGQVMVTAARFAAGEANCDIKKLQGEGVWRLRWGKWRLRLALDSAAVVVLSVDDRKDAYR
jgi:mRNA-degrading endonuclease RelE of RelBE toxin-antitoxin system